MTRERRRPLMWLVLVLLVALLFVAGAFGGIGVVEISIWFALLAIWLGVFLTWAKPRTP